MQFPRRGQPAPLGVLYDSSLDGGIDQVLALAMLFGFAALQQVRIPSLTTSRFSLQNAAFLDVVARFFRGGSRRRFRSEQDSAADRDGLDRQASRAVPPMVSAPLAKLGADGKPVYPRGIEKLNDTADPIALMRNALTAQVDQNGAVILAGLPANLLALMALPGGKDWAAKKARVLRLPAAGSRETAPIRSSVGMSAGFRKLLAEWPGRIVMAGAELNEASAVSG